MDFFASICIVNKLLNGEVVPKTMHIFTGEKLYVPGAAAVNSLIEVITFLQSFTLWCFFFIFAQLWREVYAFNPFSKIKWYSDVQGCWSRYGCLGWCRVRIGSYWDWAAKEPVFLARFISCASLVYFTLIIITEVPNTIFSSYFNYSIKCDRQSKLWLQKSGRG